MELSARLRWWYDGCTYSIVQLLARLKIKAVFYGSFGNWFRRGLFGHRNFRLDRLGFSSKNDQ